MISDKKHEIGGSQVGSQPLSEPVAFRVVTIAGVTSFPLERHAWGQFVYSLTGVIEVTVEKIRYSAPPEFGVWLPPETDHLAWASDETSYLLLDIDDGLCDQLPQSATVLPVSPIARVVLADLKRRQLDVPRSAEDARLLRVLIDQLAQGKPVDSYLPMSQDGALKKVLDMLCRNPADSRSLADWAKHVNVTERTLARRCKRDLGMSFVKWRQRLRISRAIAMLTEGLPVQVVARKLGYRTSSAFIAMFQDEIGATPHTFKCRLRDIR